MRFLRVILVMSAALFVTVFVTRAALVSAALILNLSGDLWLWNAPNQLKRLTYWGYNGAPVISPDSSRVAYLSTPKADIEELASPNPKYEVFVPGDNVYIMDLCSLKATRVGGDDAGGVRRSLPTWSPDGLSLAWTDEKNRLVTYSLKTGRRVVINSTLRFQASAPGAAVGEPLWGALGIAYLEYADASTPSLTVFSPTGKRLHERAVPAQLLAQFYTESMVWVKSGSAGPLIRFYGSSDLFDPVTGAVTTEQSKLFSTFAPAGLSALLQPTPVSSRFLQQWVLSRLNNSKLVGDDLTLAPDGERFALLTDENPNGNASRITVGDISSVTVLSLPSEDVRGMAWAGNAWRVRNLKK